MEPLAGCTREQLHAHAQHYFKHGGATEPEVVLVERDGWCAIFKDYGRTPGWFGRWLAPILIWREATALERLHGLAGIPRLYRRVDRRALLMEYLPASRWSEARPGDASYARLAELIAAMHARGVAHCDLRSPSNVLVDADGWPRIVDFVSHVHRGRAWNLPWNWLFVRLCDADDSALVKLKWRYAPHLLTAAEQASAGNDGLLARLARRSGMAVRDLIRLLVNRH